MAKIDNVIASLNSGDNVSSNVEDLNEVRELVNLMSKRRVKLREWIEKAWTYYLQGKHASFAELLESAVTRGAKTYVDYKIDLLRSNMMLMAYFVRLGCSEPSDKRAVWKEKVTALLLTVDNMQSNVSKVQHMLCRGFAYMLIDTRLQDADNYFVSALRQQPHHATALLGRGCLAYNRQEYRVALGYFKNLLLHHPQGPLDVRVGIAHCFLKLGDLTSARIAFELALEANERCLSAILGIVQLKLNEHTQSTNMEAINMLSSVFTLYQRHPIVLSWLSSYLYYSRDYNTLNSIAGNAYAATDNEELKSQNSFQIARSFHALHNYNRAFDFYGMAIKHCPEYAPPHLGVAQMYIRRGQLDKAEISLRNLLKLLPDQTQALRMLAMLFSQSDSETKQDMAVHLFNKAAKDEHYENWLGLAATYERRQMWTAALDAYDQAIRIYQRMHSITHEVPLTWLNNLAALQMHTGKPKAALQTLDKALSMIPDATQEHYESNLLTIRFNRARVLEELHMVEQAEDSYKQLIVEYPNYYDCYFRLGTMAYKRNQPKAAMEKFQAVLQLDSENEMANIFMGNYRVKEGDLEQAMNNYNAVIRRNNNFEDSYMLVAMGNVGMINLQRAIDEGDQEMTKSQIQNALQLFRKALEKNSRNLWAANGIGVVLSSRGNLPGDGESIFKQIAESSKRCPDAILNCAHEALEMEHYVEAIDLYKQHLKDYPPVNCDKVLQMLARSLFLAGRVKEAKDWLLKALHVAPKNLYVLYNLAVVIKQEGSDTFNRKESNLEDLKEAEEKLKMAQGFFNYLSDKGDFLRSSKMQANLCGEILQNLPAELKNFRLLEEQKKIQQMLDQQKKIEEQKKEFLARKSILEREQSTKRKRDREPSVHRKRSDREPSVKTRSADREPSIKPNTLQRESFSKPRTSDREPSVKPKGLQRDPSVKSRYSAREPSKPSSPKRQVRESSVKPVNLVEKSTTEPKASEHKPTTNTKSLEREPSVIPKSSETDKEQFSKQKTLDKEPVPTPKSANTNEVAKESHTMPKLIERESSSKPKREPSVKPKSLDPEPIKPTETTEEKNATLIKAETIVQPEKPEDKKVSPKADEKVEELSEEDTKQSRKKHKKRKHKSKKKKNGDSRESSTEPKEKEKKK